MPNVIGPSDARQHAQDLAAKIARQLEVEFRLDGRSAIGIEGDAVRGEGTGWVPTFSIDVDGLDEAGARRVLAAIVGARSEA